MGQEAEERTAQNEEPAAAQDSAAAPQAGNAAPPQAGDAAPPSEGPAKPMRISSPEQVDDYIRVTTPGMWLLVVAILVLLTALIIWGFTAKIEMSIEDGNGQVQTEYVAPASFVTDGMTGK